MQKQERDIRKCLLEENIECPLIKTLAETGNAETFKIRDVAAFCHACALRRNQKENDKALAALREQYQDLVDLVSRALGIQTVRPSDDEPKKDDEEKSGETMDPDH